MSSLVLRMYMMNSCTYRHPFAFSAYGEVHLRAGCDGAIVSAGWYFHLAKTVILLSGRLRGKETAINEAVRES